MKILHAPFCYYPDPMGGTEVYVRNLAMAQSRRGAQAVIAAPGTREERYTVEGLEVYRFPAGGAIDLREFYGEGDSGAAAACGRILEAVRPDVVHLHAFTSGVSLRVARLAQRAAIPVVFTYHTPTASCLRGTLLRWGTQLCHGRLDVRMCTACSLEGLGMRPAPARLVSHIPPAAGRALGAAGLSGGLWTALRMTELVALRHQAFRHLMQEVDQVVSLCSWSTDVLLGNGVPREKILLCRHGLAQDTRPAPERSRHSAAPSAPGAGNPCRMVFFGRLTPVKGLDVLIPAITADPDLAITLDVYGVAGSAQPAYREQLEKRADRRIRFLEPVRPEQVIERLGQYDVLAVPSQWLETGPLVVLEAFAAGIPVMGSDLGGIRELVRHEIDGLLVEAGSVGDWTAALRRLSREPDLLEKLRAGVRPPRTMEEVAAGMLSLYEQLLAPAARPVAAASC
jgi:glycosyltransferase involved in cell wall biosynthesis